MDDAAIELISDNLVEILPPEMQAGGPQAKTCLCCCRRCLPGAIDDDGCGICDECLAP